MNQLSDKQILALKIDFVTRSFRDMADKDYIAARITHRHGLDFQFLWFAQQAIEKYLKAILLYNGMSAKGFSHLIHEIYKKVLQIPDIKFDFPEDIGKFIKDLDLYGNNRYFEFPHSLQEDDLLQLDRTVWYIRRYCRYIRGTVEIHGKAIERLPVELREIQDKKFMQKPNLYKIFNGYLENVLKNKKSEQRAQLVWKNFYFGTYSKKKIKNYHTRFSWANPTHFMYKGIYPELEKIIDFSKPVREYFKKEKVRLNIQIFYSF